MKLVDELGLIGYVRKAGKVGSQKNHGVRSVYYFVLTCFFLSVRHK